MESRWEQRVFTYIVKHVDPDAIRGKASTSAGLDLRLFDGIPESHPAAASEIRKVYKLLSQSAHDDDRLQAGRELLMRWKLTWDIYSPKLGRFIEVDEFQHFSRPRMTRLLGHRSVRWWPVYSAYFWEKSVPRLKDRPYRDRDLTGTASQRDLRRRSHQSSGFGGIHQQVELA